MNKAVHHKAMKHDDEDSDRLSLLCLNIWVLGFLFYLIKTHFIDFYKDIPPLNL